jgi:glyoxylase-like metal-dependent hydrolase (beta-lactamase superfamily II)
VLISGDMVLPRISTNVSVYDGAGVGPAARSSWRRSTSSWRLPKDTLVLPSHGKPFRGLHTLQRIRASCTTTTATAWPK